MRTTPLHPAYASRARGTLDLLGWAYPAEFSRAVLEHHAVRRAAGLFDFSFIAHFVARGRGALSFVQRIITNDDPCRSRVRAAVPDGGHRAQLPACGRR